MDVKHIFSRYAELDGEIETTHQILLHSPRLREDNKFHNNEFYTYQRNKQTKTLAERTNIVKKDETALGSFIKGLKIPKN